eukprot:5597070-Alexandrium_andersonii.AAC.1
MESGLCRWNCPGCCHGISLSCRGAINSQPKHVVGGVHSVHLNAVLDAAEALAAAQPPRVTKYASQGEGHSCIDQQLM